MWSVLHHSHTMKLLPRKAYKIAFIGNVNCMTFQYALILKKEGHDITVFIDSARDQELHRPEYRYLEINYPYPNWIQEIEPPARDLSFLLPIGKLGELLKSLNTGDYDAVVLNGVWHKIGSGISNPKTSVICFFSGSDLDLSASYKQAISRLSLFSLIDIFRFPMRLMETWLHRKGIRAACLINYYPQGISPQGDYIIRSIMRGHQYQRISIRGLAVDEIKYSPASDRVGSDVIVFNPTRFLWSEPLPSGFTIEENKRNDIMLRGIARYIANSKTAVKIILIEKGAQLAETKDLIKELGISRFVNWCPEMSPVEIREWYKKADIVFDQLGRHWVGAGGLDAMLTGRPVIANGRPDIFSQILGEPIPLCQATNEYEVESWLSDLINSPQLRKRIGDTCREFVIKHFDASKTANAIVTFLDNRPLP
jgi:glycosyltransferase involved in cell wall biosynthesis